MNPYAGTNEMMRLCFRTAVMLAEANMVIGMQVMGMNGMWNVTPGENRRMVSEKVAAAVDAGQAIGRAALAGKSPAGVALAGLKPVKRRTGANARRLARRGPGTGN